MRCTKNDLENYKAKDLLKLIISTMLKTAIPLTPLPAALLVMGGQMRPGMSARKIAARTLQKYSEAGIPVGPLFGEENLLAKAVEANAEEMVGSIKTEAKVEMAMGPGAIQVTTIGGNIGGPVQSQGMNTTFAKGYGGIS